MHLFASTHESDVTVSHLLQRAPRPKRAARSLWRLGALLLAVAVLWLPGPWLRAGPAGQNRVSGAIDRPSGEASVRGVLHVEGWAVDTNAADGGAAERVSLYLDGAHVADAQLGFERPDIARAFGSSFVNSGWRAVLDLDTLAAPGPHELEVRIVGRDAAAPVSLRRALPVDGPPRFCVNTHLLWFDAPSAARDLDRARFNGLTSVRFDIGWDRLEPARGTLDPRYLAALDVVLDMASARGLQPILVVVGTPGWARGDAGSVLTPPDKPADFASMFGRLAAHLAHRRAVAYEIWNEPNQVTFWATPNGPDAAVYTAMLQAAHSSIKAVAPAATVLGGSLAFNDRAYLEKMYAAGAAGHFDALSLHPYSLNYAPDSVADPTRSFRQAIDDALAVLDANGDADTPLWITEMGWSSHGLTDATRADYFTRAVELVRAQPRVAHFCAFELNQADVPQGQDVGLVAADGTPTQSWLAYGAAAARAR
jgi:polysaccharide biosynthesis protein PslG